MNRHLLLLFLFFGNAVLGISADFQFHPDSLKGKSTKRFLQYFDYDAYFSKVSLENIALLEAHKRHLNQAGIDGEEFILAAFERYVQQHPFDFQNQIEAIKKLIALGELLTHAQNYIPDSAATYLMLSDLIFGTIADTLETLIDTEKVSPHDFSVRYCVRRLCDNQYCIHIATSNFTKLGYYIQAGEWAYIWQKSTTTYLKEFLTTLLIGVFLGVSGLWLIIRWRKHYKNNK